MTVIVANLDYLVQQEDLAYCRLLRSLLCHYQDLIDPLSMNWQHPYLVALALLAQPAVKLQTMTCDMRTFSDEIISDIFRNHSQDFVSFKINTLKLRTILARKPWNTVP